MNRRVAEQLESAQKVNSEIAHSMSALGISSRPSVSEWLRRKEEEKKEQIKSKLHNWHRYTKCFEKSPGHFSLK